MDLFAMDRSGLTESGDPDGVLYHDRHDVSELIVVRGTHSPPPLPDGLLYHVSEGLLTEHLIDAFTCSM